MRLVHIPRPLDIIPRPLYIPRPYIFSMEGSEQKAREPGQFGSRREEEDRLARKASKYDSLSPVQKCKMQKMHEST